MQTCNNYFIHQRALELTIKMVSPKKFVGSTKPMAARQKNATKKASCNHVISPSDIIMNRLAYNYNFRQTCCLGVRVAARVKS